MNPIYKFTLSANGSAEQQAFPVYRDDLSKDFELQTNQEFYRAKLSGNLTFERDDYDFIASQEFDAQFDVKIYISYNAGATWVEYWHGQFWKTNCTFNESDKNVTLTPDVADVYVDVLAGLEKEYNLIELAPQIVPVNLDKRPMIQVYVPGQTVIGCFLSGMWWEQECEAVTDENELENTYLFAKNNTARIVNVEQNASPEIPDVYFGAPWETGEGTHEYVNGDYKFVHQYSQTSGGNAEYFEIVRVSDGQIMWWKVFNNQPQQTYPLQLTLEPYSGAGATGNVVVYLHELSVWSRYVCDVESVGSLNTYPLPADDLVPNNRNYTRAIGYYYPNTIIFSSQLSTTPTQWGLYQPGQYYVMYQNAIAGINESFPVSRNAWGRISIWFAFDTFNWVSEEKFRKEYTLRDAYPLASVISVLLAQFAPGITHAETTDYSQFLYGTDPLLGISKRIFITPKSNMISLGYDEPAQKAPITLKRVLDMLRDCYRCYWFIDDQNRFRIEHIEFFRRGGTYTGTPVVGRDLTVERVPRTGKAWADGTSQFKFNKPEMAARYQFGWMDDVTQLFEGNPIDIVSKYVNPDNIEQIDVAQFTSDVDFILLNPGEISKDGFVLLAGVYVEAKEIESFDLSTYSQINRQLGTDGKWMTNSNKHILIPVTPGQRLKITGGPNYGAQLAWFTSDAAPVAGEDAPLVPGTSRFTRAKNTTGYYNVPIGANYLYVFWGTSNEPGAYLPAYVSLVHQPGYYLPYVNFILNGSDHILQNAYAAFIWLQQYYFYDMPARYFKYNGIQEQALGIKKLKTQTLKFPAFNDPNTLQLIKTHIGNGTIQKMSVNLSSRNAQTTLIYDTE